MLDFDYITPRLATGGALSGPEDAEELVRRGITHVIDCTNNSYETDTSWMANHPALSVLWNPTPDDGTTKGADWFVPSVEFALMAIGNPGTACYAHCHAGHNRGPSTAFAIMLAMGWAYDAAIEAIHQARPVTVGHIRYAADAANALLAAGFLA